MRDKNYHQDAETGFNACDRGEPFQPDASQGWKDGWMTCFDEMCCDTRVTTRFNVVMEFRHTPDAND